VAVFLPLVWLILTRILFPIHIDAIPGGRDFIRTERSSLGPMSAGEKATFLIFCLAAMLWVREPIVDLLRTVVDLENGLILLIFGRDGRMTDAGIAIIAALLLFIVPVNVRRREFVLDWAHASRIPFEILILFGGGLALAAAIAATGLDAYVGSMFGALDGVPVFVMVMAVCTVMIFLTELTSNTAVIATFLPILQAAASELNVHPFLLLVPATIAASCAFMLPMATPPNAIVFASGHLTIPLMARAGMWLNLTGVLVISLMVYFLGGWLLGIDFTVTPAAPSGE
jgi:sodium-dependent dicarboxylate transporter 2/3/5